MSIKLRPLEDRVWVEPLEAEKVTKGGILLPDSARDKPHRGKVLAVGPGQLLDNGVRVRVDVNVGDEILFVWHSGYGIQLDGQDKECRVLRGSDILAVVVPEGAPGDRRERMAPRGDVGDFPIHNR